MSILPFRQIHPTASISAEATLAEGVVVGPFAIIEGPVQIASGCVIKGHACLYGPLTLGRNNVVYSGAVVGDQAQHMKYAGEPAQVIIGEGNTFREHVTVHRATVATGKTTIGNNNYFMAGSHVAHDCTVGNNCILANNALMGGHCVLGDGVFLSGNTAIHQFVHVGRLALLSGCSASTKDIPPFIMQRDFNVIVGVNVVGMRRAGMNATQINGIRRAYHFLFRETTTLPEALAKTEAELGHIDAVRELIDFVKNAARGISIARTRRQSEAA